MQRYVSILCQLLKPLFPVDLGTRYTKMAMYIPSPNVHIASGSEIVKNYDANSAPLCVISWPQTDGKERLSSKAAYNQKLRNLPLTFLYITRLLGLTASDREQIERE